MTLFPLPMLLQHEKSDLLDQQEAAEADHLSHPRVWAVNAFDSEAARCQGGTRALACPRAGHAAVCE
jgi:hypothetical protein